MAAPRTAFAFSTGVPPPPDHAGEAFREASCPREMVDSLSVWRGSGPNESGARNPRGPAGEMFHKLYPIVTAEFRLRRRIEMDMVAKDLRYECVNNEFSASQLVKRMNGFKLGKADEPWAPLLRRSYTAEVGRADRRGGRPKLKVSIVTT